MPPKNKASGAKATSDGGAGAGKKKQRGSAKKREPSVSSSSGTSSGEVPDELMCGICHDLLTGAMQTPCCGGLSCLECIEDVAAQTSTCPYCRAEELSAGRLHTDVRMERAVSCFVRPCQYDGCDYRGKRDELAVHMAACDKRPGVLAELREAEMRWRKQRCWQLSSIINYSEEWTDVHRVQLEQLKCRIHVFDGKCCDAEEPRWDDSVEQSPVAPFDSLLPRTSVQLHTNAGAPYLRLCHLEDQIEPTRCYIFLPLAPSSARKITIPAKKVEAVILRSFVPTQQCNEAGDAKCSCEACYRDSDHEQAGDDEYFCACTLHVFLAPTLGDFGLTEARGYAHPGIDAY